jgi:hypothetical protein
MTDRLMNMALTDQAENPIDEDENIETVEYEPGLEEDPEVQGEADDVEGEDQTHGR